MKTTIKAGLLVAIILTISFLMPGLMDSTGYFIKAGEAEWSGGGLEPGTDAFTVVEIVPYRGMAEIGYLIGGQEPIEEELMNFDTADGAVSFLGGAISVYRNYTETALPPSGTPQSGWSLARTIATQNGYFEDVGNSAAGGRYNLGNGESYIRVADGSGTHRVELNAAEADSGVYKGAWEPTNRKNVKAYFVYGKPSGISLYNDYIGYEPRCVERSATHTGNYDYDSQTGTFYLNMGQGEYDVIFTRADGNTKLYYMKNDYQIVDDNSGDYSFPVRYVAASGGNYIKDTGDSSGKIFNYDRWNGRWRWVQDDTALNKPNYSTEGNKVWVRNQKVLLEYQFTYKVTLVNNEWFKRLTLGIPSNQVANSPVEVITITPEDLSLPENQHYIDQADLFYINANYGHNNYIQLYETYSTEGLSLPANQKYSNNALNKENNLNFAVHDMSWPTVIKTFKKIAGIGTNKAAAIIDSKFYGDAINGNGAYKNMSKSVTVSYGYNGNKATMCNMAKLYIMVYQRNTIDFYNSFLNDQEPNAQLITQVSTTVNKSGITGSFIRPDGNYSASSDPALYWNGNTFVPYGLNSGGIMTKFTQDQLVSAGIVNFNITGTPTDLMNNVLITNGQDLFTAKFVQQMSLPSDVQEGAVVHVSSVQGSVVNAGSITLGDLTNVITNNGSSYDNTGGVSYPGGGGVEGPPASTLGDGDEEFDDGTDGSGARSYKRVLNIEPTADFASSEASIRKILSDYEVQIKHMTSTEFNSSIEDINALYDMIFMGSGAGRFNQVDGINKTDFNNNSLDGSYYIAEGDAKRIIIGGSQSNVSYRGNDLTSQKKAELEAFLAAGYPIVLDKDMYAESGVRKSIFIKDFISNAKRNFPNNFLNARDYDDSFAVRVAFKVKLRNTLNVTRPTIKLLQPTLPEGSATNYIYVDPVTDRLIIQFALIPKGTLPSFYNYNAYLYMDENGDGVFSEAERLNVISSDGSSWENMSESRFRTYTYNYDMTEINGAVQWKLIIKRDDNERIRSSITGYAANTNKEDLHILHIRENSSAYNLQQRVNDTASLIQKYAGTNKLADYNLLFTSMTVQAFEQLYSAASPYTTATRATTNRLSGYHMLILDNPTTAIANTYGAVTNIKDEVAGNLSIVFTKGALGFNNQAQYYAASKTSFLNLKTYNFINLQADVSRDPLYIYSSLNTNGSMTQPSTYNTTYLTKANEGALTRYPYQINKAIRISPNSYSKDVTIDMNFANNQPLIGWYCLSDTKSPEVRKAFNTGVADDDLYKGIYSSSPNDVKNNYYLFSNGKAFYSGIDLVAADSIGNDSEIMLFVNTIITAYKSSGRTISTPPVITYTDPEPDEANIITVNQSYIEGTDFVVKFKISGSSTPMDLLITLDGANPAEAWNETVYQVDGGVVGAPIAINNTNKVIVNSKTYALKIPLAAIAGEHTLSIRATNAQGNVTNAPVTIRYIQNPVVTIEDPLPLVNASVGYMYVDIDYNALDTSENYLDTAESLRVVFKVDKSVTNVSLMVISEGEVLTDETGQKVVIYPATDDLGTPQNVSSAPGDPEVLYVMYIPTALMKNRNSRELTIRATDAYGYYGEASITLLRRSLFPLD